MLEHGTKVGARLGGLVNGEPTELDGQWLVEYDPTRPGVSPTGRPMTAHIVCSPDPAQARQFTSLKEIHALWTSPSGRVRPDGHPDRPLTAFNLVVEGLP